VIEKSFLAPLFLGTASAAILLAGCGSGKAAHTTTATRPVRAHSTTIRVYFKRGATRAQETSVEQRLRSEACVRRVVFVSKAQALKIMKTQLPQLFGAGSPLAGHSNPLPDSFTVTASKLSCAGGVRASIAAAHWPAVSLVRQGFKRAATGPASP
jgi:cell division protein FtsX